MIKLNKFLIILILFVSLLKQVSAQCYEPVDLLNEENRVKSVNCGKWIIEEDDDSNKIVDDGNDAMVQITVQCDQNAQLLCDKIQKSFDKVGKIISNTLKLKEKIMVNATFYDHCEGRIGPACPIEIRGIVASTSASKVYSLLDDDGLERLYPQALVKQFKFQEHPKYDDYDITMIIDSKKSFYFNDGITPIGKLQFDFEFIVLHELVHGLGVINSWRGYDNPTNPIGLWPRISAIDSGVDGKVKASRSDPITVKESVFNKFMIRLDNGDFTSEYTRQIEKYFLDNKNITMLNFNSDEFERTSQFQLMRQMLKLATTPNSLGFLPHNSNNYVTDAIKLETSLPRFRPGSSLGHVDSSTYNNTSDFLMVYSGLPGITLQDYIIIGGNYSGGAIGPKLKLILQTIGYATEDYQDPYKPKPFAKQQKSSSKRNSPIFNQFYIMILIIFML